MTDLYFLKNILSDLKFLFMIVVGLLHNRIGM